MQDDTITIDERDLIEALIGAQRLAAHRRTARKQKHVAKRKVESVVSMTPCNVLCVVCLCENIGVQRNSKENQQRAGQLSPDICKHKTECPHWWAQQIICPN